MLRGSIDRPSRRRYRAREFFRIASGFNQRAGFGFRVRSMMLAGAAISVRIFPPDCLSSCLSSKRAKIVAAENVGTRGAKNSDAARGNVTVHVITSAQKDNPVPCWIGLVILQLVVRYDNLGPDIDVFAP